MFWYPFKKKKVQDSLSIGKLFPALKLRVRKAVTLGLGIGEAIIGAVTGILAPLTTTFTGYAIVAGAVSVIVKAALAIGVSLGLSMLSQALAKKPSTDSIQNNGRVFNTKAVTAPRGRVQRGGIWGLQTMKSGFTGIQRGVSSKVHGWTWVKTSWSLWSV